MLLENRMKTARKRLLLCAAFVGVFVLSAVIKPLSVSAKDVLTWTVPPFAPAFVTDRPVLSGYAADIQNWFAQQMPDYDHEILNVPLARLLAEMRNTSGGIRCSSTLIPTPDRREYIAFAKTVLLHLPISVVIRKDDFDRFKPFINKDGHLLLWQLLSDGDMKTAVRTERAYGGLVDSHLSRYRKADHVMEVADDTKLLMLLARKRIDWTLYFPSEAEYYRLQFTPEQRVMTLPIEGNSKILRATIGCSNTPAGRAVIAKINAIIDDNPTMPWTDFYASWLNPQDRAWFAEARKDFIGAGIY